MEITISNMVRRHTLSRCVFSPVQSSHFPGKLHSSLAESFSPVFYNSMNKMQLLVLLTRKLLIPSSLDIKRLFLGP